MPRQDADAPWPPVAGRCPDGWMEDAIVKNKCAVPIKNNKGQIVGGRANAKRANNGTSTLTAIYPNKFRDIRGGDWLTINQIQYMVERVDRNERTLTLKNSQNSGNVRYERSIFAFEGRTICDKKKWANKWGIKWDGVSNYNKCP